MSEPSCIMLRLLVLNCTSGSKKPATPAVRVDGGKRNNRACDREDVVGCGSQ
jgi:hypothetical protein